MGGGIDGCADTSPTSLIVHFVDFHCTEQRRSHAEGGVLAERDRPGLVPSSNCLCLAGGQLRS
jgi:hypothetical protein